MNTIKEIAALAKVSVGTVDRVLHQRGGVAKKTELKIQGIIKKHGFTPNMAARHLVLQKELKVAILVPEANEQSPFWYLPNDGLKKAVTELRSFGLKARFFYYHQFDVASYEENLEKLLQEDNDGLIIVPHFAKETTLRKDTLTKLGIPYVFLNVDLDAFNNTCFIGQDSFKSGILAGRLFELSQRKNSTILIINLLEDIENRRAYDQRIKGINSFFKDSSSLALEELKLKEYNKENVRKELTKKLISNNTIRGIYFPFTNNIQHVTDYLKEIDLQMDTIVGFDLTNTNISLIKDGVLTFVIAQEPFNQAYESVKILFNFLAHNTVPEKRIVSPLQIITKENIDNYL